MATMPERMAVLETKVTAIETDMAEVKRDVKTLLRYFAQSQASEATEKSDEEQCRERSRDRRDFWFRAVPLLFSAFALVISVGAFLLDLFTNHVGG